MIVAIATGVVFALNYDGEDFCEHAPAWPNGTYLGQMHPYHSDFYRGYAERRGWDACATWATDQRNSAARGLASLGFTVVEPGQSTPIQGQPASSSDEVPAENYEGENYCRDAPAWPNGTYLGQMHPYHSDFYTRYAEKRDWDPCATWAADQRASAIRGLRELGYAVLDTQLPPPPDALGLASFYEKYLDAGGIPIVSSSKTPDAALFRARDIIGEMLVNRPDLRATIAGLGIRVAIMAKSEVTTDIPEHSDLYEAFPGIDWNTRARGLGATLIRPAISAAEENLLCYENDPYRNEDILSHEFAHTMFLGVEQQPGGAAFRARIEVAYKRAIDAGLWSETYAATNADEYWAEGVQSWFGLNDSSWPANGIHNHIDTRHELEAYDPTLANLIREVFGDTTISSSCHSLASPVGAGEEPKIVSGLVLGPDGPLGGVLVWAWRGVKDGSGYDYTNPDGAFHIWVSDGLFTLDVYAGPGCKFVGWFDGHSVTMNHDHVVRITIDGASVGGIEIRLPASTAEQPRIEACS